VPVWNELNEAQGGQALSNLARAFHLPAAQVQSGMHVMVNQLTKCTARQTQERHSLARLVELLGKGLHEKVLDTPELLGATSTQVAGNDALNVIAGRDKSKRIARHAASVAGVSEMIAEYLLPVVAAMLVGALARQTRPQFGVLAEVGAAGAAAPEAASAAELQLPLAHGGAPFGGSTGGTLRMGAGALPESFYQDLSEDIRSDRRVPGKPDAAAAARRAIVAALDARLSPLGWTTRLQRWSAGAMQSVSDEVRRRLRKPQ
jgi:hypothetical protein